MIDWLYQILPGQKIQTVKLCGDASFRCYFRVFADDKQYVLMDAPPQKEKNTPAFIKIAQFLSGVGVYVPRIVAMNLDIGFLLMEDLGDRQLSQMLNVDTVDAYYNKALTELVSMQRKIRIQNSIELPDFDGKQYWLEYSYFVDWFLPHVCDHDISHDERELLTNMYQALISTAEEQPVVFVHRDYHSRNLMVCDGERLGVLDFQDALWGPITYDVVSLLRDCYVDWPETAVMRWLRYWYDQQCASGLLASISFEEIVKWFDWMSLQRHIKCLGIFARLAYRDNKVEYLTYLPRVARYVMTVCGRYAKLQSFGQWFQTFCIPACEKRMHR